LLTTHMKRISDVGRLKREDSPIVIRGHASGRRPELVEGTNVLEHLGTVEEFDSSVVWMRVGQTSDGFVICGLPSLRLFLWDRTTRQWTGANGVWEGCEMAGEKTYLFLCGDGSLFYAPHSPVIRSLN